MNPGVLNNQSEEINIIKLFWEVNLKAGIPREILENSKG